MSTAPKTVPFKPPFMRQPKADPVIITFTTDRRFLAATKSALEDLQNQIGQKLEAPMLFAHEDALTQASVGLGAIRAAVYDVQPHGSKDYPSVT